MTNTTPDKPIKLEAFVHAGNPRLVKIKGLKIIEMPECEGGGYALSGPVALELKRLIDEDNACPASTDKPLPFDTHGHRFGMAYRTNEGCIVYVGNFSHSLGFMVRTLDQETGVIGERELSIPRSRKLYRAPEYDLVIRADLVKERENGK